MVSEAAGELKAVPECQRRVAEDSLTKEPVRKEE